jgi:hypothetical protein
MTCVYIFHSNISIEGTCLLSELVDATSSTSELYSNDEVHLILDLASLRTIAAWRIVHSSPARKFNFNIGLK